MIHRDVAARNVLVDENYTAYITDFGLSRLVAEQGKAGKTKTNIGPVKVRDGVSLGHNI